MKKNNTLFLLLAAALIVITFTGLFENRALAFLKNVSEKNLHFLALVSEIKLVLGSVGDVHIPFVSGGTAELTADLGKAQNYLFIVNVISIIQLMILVISKSWLLKIVLVALFVLSLIDRTKIVCSKLLILALALNPGLAMFSVVVQHLSQEASIDLGSAYLSQLGQSASKLQNEKAQLMQEHEKTLTQINNGDKGITLFKNLREDISYDVKKVKLDVSGDYTELRSLLKDAGQVMTRKLLIFCTSVLFCQLLLPLGYALLVFILFKSLFPGFNLQSVDGVNVEGDIQNIEKKIATP